MGGTTHTTLEEFREMYEAILDCVISNIEGNKWSSKTITYAVGLLSAYCWPTVGLLLAYCWPTIGLLCAISRSAFFAAFQVNRCMFEYTVSLNKLLQGSTQDDPQVSS